MLCIFLLKDVFESLTCWLDLCLSSLLVCIHLYEFFLSLKNCFLLNSTASQQILDSFLYLCCYECFHLYVCYCVWHYVWLNVAINKFSLLLSQIMVTWIFGHYHTVHEMHSMWFMWFSHRRYRSHVLCKLIILVRSQWWNWAFHMRRL